MDLYASNSPRNTDPTPWTYDGFGVQGRSVTHINVPNIKRDPRPEFEVPRVHDGNPILIAAREEYDRSDPWGFALGWLDALKNYDRFESTEQAAEWGESWEVRTVVSLVADDGQWTLPAATDSHIEHAYRVFDRMADVAKLNGKSY